MLPGNHPSRQPSAPFRGAWITELAWHVQWYCYARVAVAELWSSNYRSLYLHSTTNQWSRNDKNDCQNNSPNINENQIKNYNFSTIKKWYFNQTKVHLKIETLNLNFDKNLLFFYSENQKTRIGRRHKSNN